MSQQSFEQQGTLEQHRVGFVDRIMTAVNRRMLRAGFVAALSLPGMAHDASPVSAEAGDGIDLADPMYTESLQPAAKIPAGNKACANVGAEHAGEYAVMNGTVTETRGPGYGTFFSGEGDPTQFSSINFGTNDTVANGAWTKVGPTGEVCIFVSNESHAVGDIAGFAPGNVITPAQPNGLPLRVLDTRTPVEVPPLAVVSQTGRYALGLTNISDVQCSTERHPITGDPNKIISFTVTGGFANNMTFESLIRISVLDDAEGLTNGRSVPINNVGGSQLSANLYLGPERYPTLEEQRRRGSVASGIITLDNTTNMLGIPQVDRFNRTTLRYSLGCAVSL